MSRASELIDQIINEGLDLKKLKPGDKVKTIDGVIKIIRRGANALGRPGWIVKPPRGRPEYIGDDDDTSWSGATLL